jgi:hypothetical protein
MIQTNPQSDKISGYFNVSQERKIELDNEFKKVRDEQSPKILADILKNAKENGISHAGYHRVPVIDAFINLAKNEEEQLYCAYMAAQQIDFFTDCMNAAIKRALLIL